MAAAAAGLALASAPAFGGPSGSSQGAFNDPASPVGREISALFWGVTLFAFIVGILVEALLVYTIFKYRADRTTAERESGKEEDGDDTNLRDTKDAPKDSGKASTTFHPKEHGNRTVEIGIFVVTAVAFGILVFVSWNTLFAIETAPEGPSMTVQVTGHQWAWEFHYPAEQITEFESISEMHVPVNTVVKLEVTATDVLHAVWIPDLGVKIDAVPGTTNHFWFNAEREGRYLLQCAEFCGGAHSDMHATVVAESPAAYQTWVASKQAAANPPPPPLPTGTTVNVTLSEYRIYADRSLTTIDKDANITFHLWNNGSMAHSFALSAPYNLSLAAPLAPGASIDWIVLFNLSAENATYYCPIVGHAAAGMQGTFSVAAGARIIDIYLVDDNGANLRIEPSSIELTPGERVQFRAHNNGTLPHNLHFDAPYETISTATILNGQSASTPAFTVGPTATYFCAISGHRTDGMVGIMVGSGPAGEHEEEHTVPGFEVSWALPALAFAGVALLWRRDRAKAN